MHRQQFQRPCLNLLRQKRGLQLASPFPHLLQKKTKESARTKSIPTSPVKTKRANDIESPQWARGTHSDLGGFRFCDHTMGHFKPKHLETHPLWPRNCVSCDRKLLCKGAHGECDSKTECNVKDGTWMCKNCASSEHRCLHCLCMTFHRHHRQARPEATSPSGRGARNKKRKMVF